MEASARVDSKGRLTIPRSIRDALRIKHGDQRVQPMRSDPGMTEEGFQRMVLGDKFYETGVDDD